MSKDPRSVYLGIDPGKAGGLAIIYGQQVELYVMPESEDDLWELLEMISLKWLRPRAVVERVHSMPQQGVSSIFTFGTGYGIIRGQLAAAGIPREYVPPQTWMKALSVSPKKKSMSGIVWKDSLVMLAQRMYPDANWGSTKGFNRSVADALLIAEYCRRIHS